MRKIVVDVEDSGTVTARITGGHLCKRELLRVLKAIRLEYRHSVRVYRQRMTIEGHKRAAEAVEKASVKTGVKKDDEDRITEQNQ